MTDRLNEAVDETDFAERVLKANGPCLVFFDASWCTACRKLETLLLRVKSELSGRLGLVRIDADALPELLRRYGVSGIPTLAYFDRGQLTEMKLGDMPEDDLREWVTRRLEEPTPA